MAEGELQDLIDAVNRRRLPSFSVVGSADVRRGVLAGTAPDFNTPRLSRRLALILQRILRGERPEQIPVVFDRGERLTLNMATARQIGVYPSWKVLTEANLIQEARDDPSRRLRLVDAVEEAVEQNLDLAARRQATASGSATVDGARAALLPQVAAEARGTVIDENRGSAVQAQRQFSGGGSVSQIVYSEEAFTNVAVQRHLQAGRREREREQELDTVREAAVSYLRVLQAETVERIRQQNLNVSVQNLELARVREAIGYSGASDVYRWQSQIATDRKAVIEANSQRNLAEIALNRVMNRPLEEAFVTVETGLDDTDLLPAQERLMPYLGDPWSFRLLRRFLVDEGLDLSPELRRLNAAIAAQEAVVRSARRVFWLPTVGVRADAGRVLGRGGAGSTLPASGGENTWSVGLQATLPLFSGGGRVAALRAGSRELERLRLERDAAATRVEQRIRSAIHVMGASYAGIDLSRDAASAAADNLELVVDAYRRGVVTGLDLLDAQNAALVADLGAANSVYAFLLDLMEADRSVGRFSFRMTPAELDAMYDRLDTTRKAQDDASGG